MKMLTLIAEAERELAEEQRREAINRTKAELRLRRGKSWLYRVFPYTITIQKRKS